MDKLYVIKIGGQVLDNAEKLEQFLQSFAALNAFKILVHGGGKMATRLAEQLGISQQMVDGRRITDAETLKVATMVYAGLLSKDLVARLQSKGCNAIGLSGADGNLVKAHKRIASAVDYGFAGDVDEVNASLIRSLLAAGTTLVMNAITHDGQGQLLNTNADTIAQECARALCHSFSTTLIYGFEKKGVLADVNDESSCIPEITPVSFKELKEKGIVKDGMLPKLENAFQALNFGVKEVKIGLAEDLTHLIEGKTGTLITNE